MKIQKSHNFRNSYNTFNEANQRVGMQVSTEALSNLWKGSAIEEYYLEFHITHSVRQLLSEFEKSLRAEGYKCVQIFEYEMFIIRLSFKDRLKKLFWCKNPLKFILTVRTHELRSVRIVTLKALNQDNDDPREVQAGIKQIHKLLENMHTLLKPLSEPLNDLESEYRQDIFSLQATAYYMFGKILANRKYGVGSKMLSIINKAKKRNETSSSSDRDQQYWLAEALNQVSNQLLMSFNCSRKELLQILCYCRKSVEEYFHSEMKKEVRVDKSRIPDNPDKKILLKQIPLTYRELELLASQENSFNQFKSFYFIQLFFKFESTALSQAQKSQILAVINQEYSAMMRKKINKLSIYGFKHQEFGSCFATLNLDN